MVTIKAQFILNPPQYQNRACHSYGQTDNVDNGVNLVSADVAQSGFEVVGKHAHLRFWILDFGSRDILSLIEKTLGILDHFRSF
jgi:hypothetical protein